MCLAESYKIYRQVVKYAVGLEMLHQYVGGLLMVTAIRGTCPASLSEGRRPFLRAGMKCIAGKLMKIDWLAPKPIGGSYGF